MSKSNTSGIYPCGDRVLIKPDSLETTLDSGIVIPGTVAERHSLAQVIGTVVAIGPDAWTHFIEVQTDSMSTKAINRGFSSPFADVGDKVLFAKFGGLPIRGKDGEEYRLINDIDVTAKVDRDLKVGDIQSRKMFGE